MCVCEMWMLDLRESQSEPVKLNRVKMNDSEAVCQSPDEARL